MSTHCVKCNRLPVWDGQASIHSSLNGTKHLVACGGSCKSSIEVAGERTWLTINALHIEFFTSHLNLAFIHLIQAKLVQELKWQNWKQFTLHLVSQDFQQVRKSHEDNCKKNAIITNQ